MDTRLRRVVQLQVQYLTDVVVVALRVRCILHAQGHRTATACDRGGRGVTRGGGGGGDGAAAAGTRARTATDHVVAVVAVTVIAATSTTAGTVVVGGVGVVVIVAGRTTTVVATVVAAALTSTRRGRSGQFATIFGAKIVNEDIDILASDGHIGSMAWHTRRDSG
jgi:hypothetical protein